MGNDAAPPRPHVEAPRGNRVGGRERFAAQRRLVRVRPADEGRAPAATGSELDPGFWRNVQPAEALDLGLPYERTGPRQLG
ncbi:hypothetical protein GCM10010449_56730 [Streptomyces rectiviolaceus]|uniref:Uncharacterized protein n=1 Tax=Streptomyces rectiviolaceus TaxID=332591 RepID=A0ABP6MWB0_9ACTN